MRRFKLDRCVKIATQALAWTALVLSVAILGGRGSASAGAPTRLCTPEVYGARHDGVSDDTKALQQALDRCAGGGRVRLGSGVYLSGPLFLRSGETVEIARGATLLGVEDHARYVQTGRSRLALVNARAVHDIALEGGGVIDGQGRSWWAEARTAKAKGIEPVRPRLVLLTDVDGAVVRNLTLQNSPMFHLVPAHSRHVLIDHLTIRSPADAPNTDGIDPSGRDIVIQNTTIDTGDDNVAIKSGQEDPQRPGAATADITIRDCTFLHGHGLSIGSETNGGVRNILAERIAFDGTTTALRIKTPRGRGGEVSHVVYRDIRIANVGQAVLVTAYYPKIPDEDAAQPIGPATPDIHDITLERVTGSVGVKKIGGLYGLPERPVRNVTFKQVELSGDEGLTVANAELSLDGSRLAALHGPTLIRRRGAVIYGAD